LAEDAVAALLGLWPVVGLFLDGWAHHTRPELESFFTPWHAVLYSGAAANTAWLAVLVARRRKSGRSLREAVPPGYGLAVVGGLGFGLAGLADMAWHTIFGIEVDLEALLSPSHLLLLASGLLALTAPLRAALLRADSGERDATALLPAVASLTAAVAIVAFFFHYLSPFHEVAAATRQRGGHDAGAGLASIFVTNGILVAPLILLVKGFGSAPRAGATILFTTVAALLLLESDFAFPAAVGAALAAGIAVDALFALIRPNLLDPGRVWLAAALAPVLLWGAYFLAVAVARGVAWSPELWTGAIAMSSLMGLGMGYLAVSGRRPGPQPPL